MSDIELDQWAEPTSLSLEDRAKKVFPGAEPAVAFAKYIRRHNIQDVFFLNDGGRYVWGKNIDCLSNKSICKGFPAEVYKQMSYDGRNYMLPRSIPRTSKERMELIDSRKMKDGSTLEETAPLIAHTSEAGWNLPKLEYNRHFLNFPEEIRECIFEYVLCADTEVSLSPRVITSNWKTEFRGVRCENEKFWRHHPFGSNPKDSWEGGSLVRFESHQDSQGTFTMLRRILRRDVDATSLRTSKRFFDSGVRLLYGHNTFSFQMTKSQWRANAPTMLPSLEVHRPDPKKPSPQQSDADISLAIDSAVRQIRNRAPSMSLEGWVYYDQFLRFLHTIGPKNASYIRNLTFKGIAKTHSCIDAACSWCADDLVHSMRIYVAYIVQLCPALESLTLQVWNDKYSRGIPANNLTDDGPQNTEEALLPLLENDIRRINSLKVLKVWTDKGDELRCAKPTIQWFADRVAQRLRLARLKDASEEAALVRANNLHCGFCGEDHLWPVCHNLCNFCGGFGHFRETCEERLRMET